MDASKSPFTKSTNVRPLSQRAFAAAVRAMATVRPSLAAQWMVKGFCTPQRPKTSRWQKGLEPEREFTNVEGEQIALYRWGPALNGKKVVLAHGWAGRSEQLRFVVEPLRGSGFEVYAFDQTAHGASSGKTSTLPRFARTVSAVCRHLGDVYAVVAHSLGAPAAAYAISLGLPIDRLVMIAPPAHPQRFITSFWRSLGIDDSLGELMIHHIEEAEGVRLKAFDVSLLAPKLHLPALIVHDRSDREVPFSEGEEWSRDLNDTQLLATEGLGHNRLLAAPVVTEAILDFLEAQRVAQAVAR